MKLRAAAVSAVVAMSALSLVGCSTEARAERKGKEFGEQICKAKDADSPEEAQRHIDNANDKRFAMPRLPAEPITHEQVQDSGVNGERPGSSRPVLNDRPHPLRETHCE